MHISEQHTNTNRKNQNLRHPIKFQLQFLMAHSDKKVKINDDTEPPCLQAIPKSKHITIMLTQGYAQGRGIARLQPTISNEKKNNLLFEYCYVVHLFY
jgi:hypothetical protein